MTDRQKYRIVNNISKQGFFDTRGRHLRYKLVQVKEVPKSDEDDLQF